MGRVGGHAVKFRRGRYTAAAVLDALAAVLGHLPGCARAADAVNLLATDVLLGRPTRRNP